jgi:transcriptional regulator with XRE-family HTH domain
MQKLTRLRVVRERKAITQAQLAKRSGINESTIRRAEHQEITPQSATTRALAKALGVPPSELMAPD